MNGRRAVLKVDRGKDRRELSLADAVSQVADLHALAATITALNSDGKVSLENVWLGSVAPLVAGWQKRDERPILIVVPHVAEAESVGAEISELTGQAVDVFPPGSEETELESLAHQETAQRLHVLSRLYKFFNEPEQAAAQHMPVIVTTLPALLQSVPSPQSLEGDKQVLTSGKRIDLTGLRKWLVKAGYHATSSVGHRADRS